MRERLRFKEKALYRIVNAGLLICMVLFGGESFLGIGKLNAGHLMAAFAVLGILAGINYISARGRIICLAVFLILLCAGVAADPAGSPDFWKSFFFWLVGKDTALQKWKTGFELLQTVLLAAACYLIQILFEKMPLLKAEAAIVLLGIMVFCLLTRRELNRFGMAFMLCFLLMNWQEWVQRHWEKERIESSFQIHSFWILPFLVLYLVFLMVTPAPEEPYDWMWAKAVYRQIQESFQTYAQRIKWGSREGFGMAFTGFSREGALGGDLQEDVREIMKVQVKPSDVENLYLTGMVYDSFDGREWSRTRQGYTDAVFLDTAQLLYAVKNYDRRYQNDYLREVMVNIRYEDFSTGYVFSPLKIWNLEEGDSERRNSGGDGNYTCEDGFVRWNSRKGYGTEYGLRYFHLNAGQMQFDLFLEEAGKTDEINEAVWEEVRKECKKRNGYTFTLSDMGNYRKEIYEHYLGEVQLSKELESYLEEILEGAETDVEKLRTMESVLSAYAYTLTPGELPESVKDAGDFLDYFLLESRQGYCTYFATAFVLLARAEGIPARYVQGYCVPIGEHGEANVYSYMAHAWPEAYLEGVGWIPFEPTPGYGGRRYDPWKLQQTAGNVSAGTDNLAAGNYGFGTGAGMAEVIGETDDMAGTDGMEDEENENSEPETASGYSRKVFCSAAMTVLAICGVVLIFDNLLGRYRYGKLSPELRLRIEVFRNLRVLSCFGLERETWETLEEFRERSGCLLEQYAKGGAAHLPEQYEEERANHLPGQNAEKRINHPREWDAEKRINHPRGRNAENRINHLRGWNAEKRTNHPREWDAEKRVIHLSGQNEEGETLSLRFTEHYERVVYGGESAGEYMIKEAVQERERLLQLLKQKRRWVWLYCRVRLCLGRYRV